MKRLVFFLIAVCASIMALAQQLTVKSVNLRPQDARARTNPRDDAKGQKCAIIRVGVVGVENLVFPDAVPCNACNHHLKIVYSLQEQQAD